MCFATFDSMLAADWSETIGAPHFAARESRRVPDYRRPPRWARELSSASVLLSRTTNSHNLVFAATFSLRVPDEPACIALNVGYSRRWEPLLELDFARPPGEAAAAAAGPLRLICQCLTADAPAGDHAAGTWLAVGVHATENNVHIVVGDVLVQFDRNPQVFAARGHWDKAVLTLASRPAEPGASTLRMTLARLALYVDDTRRQCRAIRELLQSDADAATVPDLYYALDDPLEDGRCDTRPLVCDNLSAAWSALAGPETQRWSDPALVHALCRDDGTRMRCEPLLDGGGVLADVELCAGNEPDAPPVAAHRCVLSAGSDYFRALFAGGSVGAFREAAAPPPRVVVPDCGRGALELLVRLLYGMPLHDERVHVPPRRTLFARWGLRPSSDCGVRHEDGAMPLGDVVRELMELACLADMLQVRGVSFLCVVLLTARSMFASLQQVVELLLAMPHTQNRLAEVRRSYVAWLAFRRELLDAEPELLARLAADGALAEIDEEALRMLGAHSGRTTGAHSGRTTGAHSPCDGRGRDEAPTQRTRHPHPNIASQSPSPRMLPLPQ